MKIGINVGDKDNVLGRIEADGEPILNKEGNLIGVRLNATGELLSSLERLRDDVVLSELVDRNDGGEENGENK